MNRQKVFAIGFHRTGTTSLQTALEEFGYSVVGMRSNEWSVYVSGELDALWPTVQEFDGFRDMPWPLLYRWLYKNVSGAKFILTYRDPINWARSCVGNYKDRPYEMFPVIYGFDVFAGNEARAIEIYERHIAEVRRFFEDKPDSFLEVDVTEGMQWQTLCDFLDESLPERAFPHANKRPQNSFRKLYYRLLRYLSPKRYRRMVRDKN